MGIGVTITLPDGSKKEFDGPISGMEVAASIGVGLAKAALAVVVDGAQWDLDRTIEADASIAIITRDSDEGLELLRHDCAHVLAEAVKTIARLRITDEAQEGFTAFLQKRKPKWVTE